MWKCVGAQEMARGLGVGVGRGDGNKGRGVGIDQLTDVNIWTYSGKPWRTT